MPRYFAKFPKLAYTRNGITTGVTDILTRIDIIKSSLDIVSLFYEYNIQEGDTPESIASKLYGDTELHWVVLLFNNVIDPYYDWPMHYQQFISYINEKYGSQAAAQSTHHHYEKIITKVEEISNQTSTEIFIIDENTYNSMPAEPQTQTVVFSGSSYTITTQRKDVDAFEYEETLNESKRLIKLVKPDYIPQLRNQFEILMSK